MYLTAASGSSGEKLATPPFWVTQRLPSGPVVIPTGLVTSVGLNSVTVPFGVIRATSFVWSRVTQMLPSGPFVSSLLGPTPETVELAVDVRRGRGGRGRDRGQAERRAERGEGSGSE